MSAPPKDDEPTEPPAVRAPLLGEARDRAAWRTWLSAMATDADAAVAAALAYEALGDDGRDAWLDALKDDAPHVKVPAVALYAPLLGVESDEGRRARIADTLAGSQPPPSDNVRAGAKALRGAAGEGYVCIVLLPLYLDFVELLACRYHPRRGVEVANHEPLCHRDQVPSRAAALLGDVALAPAALSDVVEELAHAVVADRRDGRPAPRAFDRFIHLFAPDFEEAARRPG
jgi:hypothetical protein